MEQLLFLTQLQKSISKKLQGFDLPEKRLDLNKIENVRWLLRNIRVRNEVSEDVITDLKSLEYRLNWEQNIGN